MDRKFVVMLAVEGQEAGALLGLFPGNRARALYAYVVYDWLGYGSDPIDENRLKMPARVFGEVSSAFRRSGRSACCPSPAMIDVGSKRA